MSYDFTGANSNPRSGEGLSEIRLSAERGASIRIFRKCVRRQPLYLNLELCKLYAKSFDGLVPPAGIRRVRRPSRLERSIRTPHTLRAAEHASVSGLSNARLDRRYWAVAADLQTKNIGARREAVKLIRPFELRSATDAPLPCTLTCTG